MKKKKPAGGVAAWKARQKAIHSADGLMEKAVALAATESVNPKQTRAALLQAALFYEAAARAYRRGTLGLMARKPWAAAKECYRRLGDHAGVNKCDAQSSAIPTYWGDDDSSQAQNA